MANVAKNLKSLRQEKELTQEALSERLHGEHGCQKTGTPLIAATLHACAASPAGRSF